MPSKDVMDRIKMAHGLTVIIEQLTESVGEGLDEQLSPHLRPGEATPDLELVQRLMGRLVMARLEVLIAAHEVYGDAFMELDDDALDLLAFDDEFDPDFDD